MEIQNQKTVATDVVRPVTPDDEEQRGSSRGQETLASLDSQSEDAKSTSDSQTAEVSSAPPTAKGDDGGGPGGGDALSLRNTMSPQYKWNIVIFVSLAGTFSPLSSNIYFPAIDTISHDLGVSTSLVALTVTVYMVVQGLAPSLLAVFSDTYGRRLAFAATLFVYTAANLALAFVPDFPSLMVLRGLQAAGSAATISISSGVISDIATPGERGRFMGTNAGLRYDYSPLCSHLPACPIANHVNHAA